MLFNLNRYSQNPAQCHIIDPSTGSINYANLQANSKRVAEALQAKYPDKFVEVNAVREENSVKDGVDFSKPEEKRQYFNNLFEEYNKLESFEEKIKYFNENFYDISNLEEKEQKVILNAYETGKLLDRKETDYQNNGLDEKEAHVKAVVDIKEETGKSEQEIENSAQLKDIIENKSIYYQQLNNPNLSENRKEEINAILADLDKQETNLRELLGEIEQEIIIDKKEHDIDLSNTEIENLFSKNDSETLDIGSLFTNIENENQFEIETNEINDLPNETFDMDNLFADIENENQLEDELKIEASQETNESNDPTKTIEYIEEVKENPLQKFINNIRTRFFNNTKMLNEGQTNRLQPKHITLQNEEFAQENSTKELPEKQGIWSRLEHIISKLINKNQPKLIDTAENNTKTTDEETLSAFDKSLLVTEEEQARNKAIYEATRTSTKSVKQHNNIQVEDSRSS